MLYFISFPPPSNGGVAIIGYPETEIKKNKNKEFKVKKLLYGDLFLDHSLSRFWVLPAFYFVINFTAQHIFDYQYLGYHRQTYQTLVFTFLGSRSVYKF